MLKEKTGSVPKSTRWHFQSNTDQESHLDTAAIKHPERSALRKEGLVPSHI